MVWGHWLSIADRSRATQGRKGKRRAILSDWLDSLNALHRQMLDWLKACDPENLIDRTIEQVPGRELAFSDYQVPVLKLTLVDRSVHVQAVARFMAAMRPPGADTPVRVQGGVELRGLGGRDCYLFLLSDGKWYLQKEFENLRTSGNDVVPLNAERFEAVVRESL